MNHSTPVPVPPARPVARRPVLGAMLERLGLVSPRDLGRALERQAAEGGRLGTCLLDLGLIDEAALLAALGALHGAATADVGALDAAPREMTDVLPARAARHAHAVALARTGNTLEVAMEDPASLALVDELAAVTRYRISPRLALELRIGEALERIYGVELDPRLRRTRARMEKRAAAANPDPEDPSGTAS